MPVDTNVWIEDGQERFLGCLPRTTDPDGSIFPIVGSPGTIDILPRSQWTETSLRHPFWNIHDQGQQNSCCPTAYAGLLETMREAQGLARIPLSQAYPYRYTNGGRDQGATLDGVFLAIRDRGITPASVIDPMDWQGRNWPADADELAAELRIVEGWDCISVDAIGSVTEAGFCVALGVWWGYPRRSGGHAIYVIGKRKTPGGLWEFEMVNSWGKQWGNNGLGYLPEVQIADGLATFGGFVPRFQRIQQSDPLPLPPT